MPSFITNSQALQKFEETTGFSYLVLGDFGDNIFGLIIGNIFNVLYLLRYYIIVAIILGAIISFSYTAFRFYRH